MDNGQWKTENGQQTMGNGILPIDRCPFSIVSCPLCVGYWLKIAFPIAHSKHRFLSQYSFFNWIKACV